MVLPNFLRDLHLLVYFNLWEKRFHIRRGLDFFCCRERSPCGFANKPWLGALSVTDYGLYSGSTSELIMLTARLVEVSDLHDLEVI